MKLFREPRGQSWNIVRGYLTARSLKGFLTYPLQFRTILPITSGKKQFLTSDKHFFARAIE
jgi:hypothetical protein